MNNERHSLEDIMIKWEAKNEKTKKHEAYCDLLHDLKSNIKKKLKEYI
jgi:hypothetical protein